jgi:alpha-1,3-mannosyl-glycoprotein beta-1,2-N-acetylglucosaminyltransferase
VAQSSSSRDVNSLGLDTALLIIRSNRPEYLERTLSHVVKYHPRKSLPIIISQDGSHPKVNEVIEKYQKQFQEISSISFNSIHFIPDNNKFYENGYFRLADHFIFALNAVFENTKYSFQRVIILEEDLQIAPDFFEYFAALFPLLDDPLNNLLAISAWNDNGFDALVKDAKQVYRSDFFPGLGWMLTKAIWDELKVKWPRAYWDDWLREPKQRKDRHILRPEVCRTLHFGTHGVSNAQYSQYLKTIKLNEEYVEFTKLDNSYLLEKNWNEKYVSQIVKNAKETTVEDFPIVVGNNRNIKDVKLYYRSIDENSRDRDSFRRLAEWSGAMNNVKAAVPRTAYKGIVTVWKDNIRVHLVPRNSDV